MAQLTRWFDRKFDFSFRVELYPNICARLRGTPARLDELLRLPSAEIRTRKPENTWSAQEHAGHLLDLEPLWMARVEDFVRGTDELSVADLSNRKTDEANHNAHLLEEILSHFRQERLRLANRIENIDPQTFSRSLVHPRLKQPMRLVDHLYFVAEHDDHHLARIWELVATQ